MGNDMDNVLRCPDCGSDRVTTEYHQSFMVNTGEHYCHAVKPHDPDSPASCLYCGWSGIRAHLTCEELV